MTRLNTKGFSAIEIILIIVLVTVLGGTGWYVWNRNKNDNRNVSQTNASTSPAPSKPTNNPVSRLDTLSLVNGDIKFAIPTDWSALKEPDYLVICKPYATSNVKCVSETSAASISPKSRPQNGSGEPFYINIRVFKSENDKTAKQWYREDLDESIESENDKSSSAAINGYDTYYNVQTTESYTDKLYVFKTKKYAVVVWSRIAEKHFDTAGKVDDVKDFTKYVNDIEAFAKSVQIK